MGGKLEGAAAIGELVYFGPFSDNDILELHSNRGNDVEFIPAVDDGDERGQWTGRRNHR